MEFIDYLKEHPLVLGLLIGLLVGLAAAVVTWKSGFSARRALRIASSATTLPCTSDMTTNRVIGERPRRG